MKRDTIMRRIVSAAAVAMLFAGPGGTLAFAEDSGGPSVRVVMPADIAPTVRSEDPDQASGRAVHRRVITGPRDGFTGLDVGYNVYARGVGTDMPYAYTKDELCYFPSGEIDMESDGIRVIASQGYLMWRQAGAPTQHIRAIKDSVTICAFTPARADPSSHRLPPAEVGRWTGEEKLRPRVVFYNVNIARDAPCAECTGDVKQRTVLSEAKDGSRYASVAYYLFQAGGRRQGAAPGDEICWVESGEFAVGIGRDRATAKTPAFIARKGGLVSASIEAVSPGNLLCFKENGTAR